MVNPRGGSVETTHINMVMVDRRKTKMTDEHFAKVAADLKTIQKGIHFLTRGFPPQWGLTVPADTRVIDGPKGTVTLSVEIPEPFLAWLQHYKPRRVEFVDPAEVMKRWGRNG